MQAASLKALRHLTWLLFALSLLLLYPTSQFLRFPRMSLAWAALIWIPINLWSALGGAWCTGFGRFRLLSVLLIAAACLRLVAGIVATSFYPWAESGIGASILAGLIPASIVVFSPHHGTAARLRSFLFDREFLLYGLAALAVSFGAFVFLQGDQLIAQRWFPGEQLGRYSGAGLLGRIVVWASLPVLTVYFTRRSGHDRDRPSPMPLLGVYLAMIGAGAIAVIVLHPLLLKFFLGVADPSLGQMTTRFALAMIPIGILQALGCHFLAARRIPECLIFGICGLLYLAALIFLGRTPSLMLTYMSDGASTATVLLLLISFAMDVPLSKSPTSTP